MTAPAFTGAFTMVDPEHVAQVGPAAALLYGRIAWRCEATGSWTASRATLAAETGLSPDSIRTALRVLREAEWVTGERASATDATMVWQPVSAGQPDRGKVPTSCGESPHLHVGDSPISSIETGKTNTPPTPLAGGDPPALFPPSDQGGKCATPPAEDPRFAAWWKVYPRKVGKGAARKAWAKAVRTVSPDVLDAALAKQRAYLAGENDRGYCPHPSTWLNEERWADEAPRNVHHLRPVPRPDEAYDPAYEATLPPPPKRDLFA